MARPEDASARRIAPAALEQALRDGQELALLDVREVGLFARKHLLHAVCAPLWRLELLLGRLVPRRGTRVVLTDLEGSLAPRAAALLRRLGYGDVAVLEGGTQAWEAAGYETFTGVNVPSKAWGEMVELEARTPHIDVAQLRQRIARGDPLVIVDGRTPEEFRNFALPGAWSVPNAELPYRIRELAPDPSTLVVVNCAGRTRSIIGAQTLRDAGLPNPVVSLQDGTMAWLLAGHALEQGRATVLPQPGAASLAAARTNAQALLRRAGVRSLDAGGLARLQARGDITLYRFDVRTEAEYRAGHLPGWRWAPGGQLVQATDEYIGTRNAHVVIADHDGVRAASTAAWLAQLGGWQVFVHAPPANAALETGPEPGQLLPDPALPAAPWIAPHTAWTLVRSGAARIVDVDDSLRFRRRHIRGAAFIAPQRLPELLPEVAGAGEVIVTCADGVLAQRVASQLLQRGFRARAVLGGNAAWFAAELPTASGDEGKLTGEEDAWYGGYHAAAETERNARFREYLAWEVGLVAQLQRPGAWAPFRRLPGQGVAG